ncbi:MAG: hypothetical protein H6661_02610 [Ardenticatenaceae bacterium]|nr:hypothetical protein [Ardenticatenaceae bacterium]
MLPELLPALDLTLTLLAQGLLRTFARHLPGFCLEQPGLSVCQFFWRAIRPLP